ncbi:MAG: hypothetical protein KIT34_11015 [Cyanobacteria bacterium TGS_CYA1]|nr:hypothetical protein [Cyanobacteria bacterium TGS_CYA1]MDX2104933.1 hypothetical protein [Candidatus Melainabacteria bacterium]
MQDNKPEDEKVGFDFDSFIGKVTVFRYNLQKEAEIKIKRKAAISSLGAAAVNLCSALDQKGNVGSESKIVVAELGNDAIHIKAEKRFLTMTIVSGVSSDADMPNSRKERCAQIFTYFYLGDDDTATLVSRLSIYHNGDITDGTTTWNLASGVEGCYPFMEDLMDRFIFNLNLVWRYGKELPDHISKVPVDDGDIHIEHLRQTSGQFTVK